MGAGQVFRVSFLFRGFSGSATELYGAETTVELSQDDGLYGVKTTAASIGITAESDGLLSDFYNTDDRDVLVVHKKLVSTSPDVWQNVFVGWLTPWGATEPYERAPYYIKLEATCGLGTLQDFPYSDALSLTTVHDILYNCLLKTGYELPLWIASYLYEESHLQSGNNPALEFNALKNVRLDAQGFVKGGERMNCFEILSRFADAGYLICQDSGVWKIKRQEHNIDFYNSFTWLKYTSSADEAPVASTGSILKQCYFDEEIVPLSGCNFGVEQAIRRLETTFEYGDLINRLRNGLFASGFSGWTINPSFSPVPALVGDGSVDNPFGVRIAGNASPRVPEAMTQALSVTRTITTPIGIEVTLPKNAPPPVRINKERHIVSFSGVYVNTDCAGAVARIKCESSAGTHWLKMDGGWSNSKNDDLTLYFRNTYTASNNKEQAKPTAGETFSVNASEPVPGLGDYKLTVYLHPGLPFAPNDARSTATVVLRELQLTIEDTNKLVVEKEIVTATVAGLSALARVRKETLTLHMGEQTTARDGAGVRYGSFRRIDGSITHYWQTITQSGILRDKWQNHATRARIRLQGALGQYIEGDVLGDINPTDILYVVETGKRYIIWQWQRNENRRTCSIKAVELLDKAGFSLSGAYETKDGARVPMTGEVSFNGTPVTVSTPGSTSLTSGDTGTINYIKNKIGAQVQGVVVPAGYNPNSGISGHVINESGAIVQTIEPREWLFLSQTL